MLRRGGATFVQRNQHLLFAVNESRGVVAGEFEAMAVRNRVGGTGFYTVAAKDTAVVVDVIDIRIALAAAEAGFRSILCGFDVDAIGWAGRRAQKAGDALFQAVFIALQNMGAAITLFEARRPVRILLGDSGLQHLLESDAHAFGDRSRGPNYIR